MEDRFSHKKTFDSTPSHQTFSANERRELPYSKFLETRYWENTKQIILSRDDWTCQDCGYTDNSGKTLDVHHLTYAHRGDEQNHLEDLVVLCHLCHAIEHCKPPSRKHTANAGHVGRFSVSVLLKNALSSGDEDLIQQARIAAKQILSQLRNGGGI